MTLFPQAEPPPSPSPPPRAGALAPPRPNLGPEPWRDDAPHWSVLLGFAFAGVCVLALYVRLRRPTPPPALACDETAASPEADLLALADQLRGAMVERLGTSLKARTTEELADDPRIADLLGADHERFVEMLLIADRIKFAPSQLTAEIVASLPGWNAWSKEVLASVRRAEQPRRQKP